MLDEHDNDRAEVTPAEPDPPGAPSGLPTEEAEAPPLGVPEEPGEEPDPGPEAMPGIPTDGEPPAAG
jgi:hypothetical protein